MRRRDEPPLYRTGTGSYYSESREKPIEDASPESYFGAGLERISRQLKATAEDLAALSRDPRFRAATGSYYSGSRERPIETAAPEAYFGAGTEMSLAERERAVAQREADVARREEMMNREQARVLGYPSGTGSYYSESRERPIEEASQGVRQIKRD